MNNRLRNGARSAIAAVALLAAFAAQATQGVADRLIRTKAAGIDIIVYPMDVPNVTTMIGIMPLGDGVIASRKANPAVPGLAVSMLGDGTTKHDKFQIADMLANEGASLGFTLQGHEVYIQGRSLKEDVGLLVRLAAEQLRSPAYAPAELEKAKVNQQAELQMALDDPGAVVNEALALALYPASNPEAVVPNADMAKALGKVKAADLRAFHKRYFGPEHMTLVFTGDVDAKEIERLVTTEFAGWTGGVPIIRGVGETLTPAVLSKDIPIADKSSVSVIWGVPTGVMISDADAYPLALGTMVLGNGFTSRLLGSVRDKEGLTYGIGANARIDGQSGGSLQVSTSFAPELLDRGIASTRRELDKWYRDGITAEELAARKTAAIGSQRLGLGNTIGMAYTLIGLVANGEPLSSIDTFDDRVNAVTVEQVNAVIRKYGDPSKLMMVRAGTFPKK